MEKAKKILKKPLLIGSICVIVAFVLGLIIMGTVPYAEATYKYNLGDLMSVEIEVEDDEVTITTTALGSTTVEEFDSMIKNGKLYVKEDPTSSEYTEFGEINSYELKLKELVDEDDPSQGYMYLTLECGLTHALKIVNIVMICFGGVSLATSVGVILYDKVHAKKEDSKPSQEA